MKYVIQFIGKIGLCVLMTHTAYAQSTAVGNWRTHFAYNSANSIELVDDVIYTAGMQLNTYSLSEQEYSSYSKVNGLSDADISLIRYDKESKFLIIIYSNGNIDLLNQGQFSNIPNIKNQNITGSKRINSVFFKNQLMYLSTDFGIVVINPLRNEIKETYVLQLNSQQLEIKDLCIFNGFFFAATDKGLYKADINNIELQNYNSWTQVISTPLNFVFTQNNLLFAASKINLYQVQGSALNSLYTTTNGISRIRTGSSDFYICEQGNKKSVKIFNGSGVLLDSAMQINPGDVVERNSNELWEADNWEGCVKLNGRTSKELVNPNGIYSNSVYNLSYSNDQIWVAGGGELAWVYAFNRTGISQLTPEGDWVWYNANNGIQAMDSVLDIVDVAVDVRNQNIYGASFGGGLLEIHPDRSTKVYKNTPYILPFGSSYRITGLAFDEKNNLWMSNYGSEAQLVVKKADGSWQSFGFPYGVSEKAASQVVIDNANQKWVVAPRGIGIYVLNDNNTIDNKSDDAIRYLRMGGGVGNLPNNEVNCIAKDKNGKLWVGTADGIGIFNCPESITSTSGCDAELKTVQYDQDAGHLFQRENVRTIAVDGANNKWIGTNNGVWQISDDAEKILQRFTMQNSPLPSNEINKILIHPKTGVVYFATNAGLVSYRSEATDGNETQDALTVFPNPVPSGYQGKISITGLVENSDVRITDIAGQLIYRTKAQGGQAVWNGKHYTGTQPKTGVYYVFVTNADGSETKAGKFIYNE